VPPLNEPLLIQPPCCSSTAPPSPQTQSHHSHFPAPHCPPQTAWPTGDASSKPVRPPEHVAAMIFRCRALRAPSSHTAPAALRYICHPFSPTAPPPPLLLTAVDPSPLPRSPRRNLVASQANPSTQRSTPAAYLQAMPHQRSTRGRNGLSVGGQPCQRRSRSRQTTLVATPPSPAAASPAQRHARPIRMQRLAGTHPKSK
jgi:hypothetical protein